jgi:hypothetical protein
LLKHSPRFSDSEKAKMLTIKGVGATVIARLEQIGFSSLAELKDADSSAITKQISLMMGSTCWHNSPLAKNAVGGIISLANDDGEIEH